MEAGIHPQKREKAISALEGDTHFIGHGFGAIEKNVNPTEPEKGAVLVLEDGTIVKGVGFGSVKKSSGEVVFNTGMVGYPEAITDPSYKGQILMQTYPLIGNYGVCPDNFESDGPKIEGYIVRELCRTPSHWASETTLSGWLEKSGVPAIEHVDTRALTKKIRMQGTMLGILWVYEKGDEPDVKDLLEEVKRVQDPNKRDLVTEVATDRVKKFDAQSALNVTLIDCGVKMSIIRSLLKRNLNVIVVPPKISVDEILDFNPAGVVISNGPGDPKICSAIIQTTRELIETEIPMMGICLGNQILALAFGGDTYKLKFGHRGQNHPCVDLNTGRCYITSQNHGFAIDAKSLKETGLKLTFINANDKTVEGVAHKTKPIFSVQFHPEGSPGPNDTTFLFERFLENVQKYTKVKTNA